MSVAQHLDIDFLSWPGSYQWTTFLGPLHQRTFQSLSFAFSVWWLLPPIWALSRAHVFQLKHYRFTVIRTDLEWFSTVLSTVKRSLLPPKTWFPQYGSVRRSVRLLLLESLHAQILSLSRLKIAGTNHAYVAGCWLSRSLHLQQFVRNRDTVVRVTYSNIKAAALNVQTVEVCRPPSVIFRAVDFRTYTKLNAPLMFVVRCLRCFR